MALRLSGILIKAWDGSMTGSFLEQFARVVGPAHALGITPGACGYSYGNNISAGQEPCAALWMRVQTG